MSSSVVPLMSNLRLTLLQSVRRAVAAKKIIQKAENDEIILFSQSNPYLCVKT